MLKQPIGQKLLTNIACVKLKKQNKVFEIACYRNKVTDWRNKQESDIGQVLQIDQIFTDVERGNVASKADLKKFGKMSREDIIIEILNKGEFQMSELEREDKAGKIKLDIANWISSQCINTQTGNEFPGTIILRAMNEINCKVVHTKNAKQQALPILTELKRVLPIERARMHVKVTFQNQESSEAFTKQLQEGHAAEHEVNLERPQNGAVEVFTTMEKSLYRVVQDIIKSDKALFKNVTVEIQDQATFNAAVQTAGGPQVASAQAAMANMSISAAEEEKKQ